MSHGGSNQITQDGMPNQFWILHDPLTGTISVVYFHLGACIPVCFGKKLLRVNTSVPRMYFQESMGTRQCVIDHSI